MSKLIDSINESNLNPNVSKYPDFKAGDSVAVHAKIKEGSKMFMPNRLSSFAGKYICELQIRLVLPPETTTTTSKSYSEKGCVTD